MEKLTQTVTIMIEEAWKDGYRKAQEEISRTMSKVVCEKADEKYKQSAFYKSFLEGINEEN